MPYEIKKLPNKKFSVVNIDTGRKMSKGTSFQKAKRQFNLLNNLYKNEISNYKLDMKKGGALDNEFKGLLNMTHKEIKKVPELHTLTKTIFKDIVPLITKGGRKYEPDELEKIAGTIMKDLQRGGVAVGGSRASGYVAALLSGKFKDENFDIKKVKNPSKDLKKEAEKLETEPIAEVELSKINNYDEFKKYLEKNEIKDFDVLMRNSDKMIEFFKEHGKVITSSNELNRYRGIVRNIKTAFDKIVQRFINKNLKGVKDIKEIEHIQNLINQEFDKAVAKGGAMIAGAMLAGKTKTKPKPKQKQKRKLSEWNKLVMDMTKKHPDKDFYEVVKMAKKVYKS